MVIIKKKKREINILTRYSLKGLRPCLFPLGKLLRLPVKSKNRVKGSKCHGMTKEHPHQLCWPAGSKELLRCGCAHRKPRQHSLRFTCRSQTNVLEMTDAKHLVLQ